MALEEYKRKRDFKKTPEPIPKKKSSKKQLIFVVQKHDARNLHYDFRLEKNGVLISWAVPKGPSMNPKDRRLAMKVEDHPYDYRDFEGFIPKGEYGAGEVIVWDRGFYAPVNGTNDRKENEKILTAQLNKGDLKLLLAGEKLKGEFALVNMRRDEKSWLLLKKKDEYAANKDILLNDKSVLSGETIEELKELAYEERNDVNGSSSKSKAFIKSKYGKARNIKSKVKKKS